MALFDPLDKHPPVRTVHGGHLADRAVQADLADLVLIPHAYQAALRVGLKGRILFVAENHRIAVGEMAFRVERAIPLPMPKRF